MEKKENLDGFIARKIMKFQLQNGYTWNGVHKGTEYSLSTTVWKPTEEIKQAFLAIEALGDDIQFSLKKTNARWTTELGKDGYSVTSQAKTKEKSICLAIQKLYLLKEEVTVKPR